MKNKKSSFILFETIDTHEYIVENHPHFVNKDGRMWKLAKSIKELKEKNLVALDLKNI